MERSPNNAKRRRLSDSNILSPTWHSSSAGGGAFTTPARHTTTNMQTPSRTLTPYSRRAMDILNTPRRPLPLSSHQRQRQQPRFSFRNQLKALGRALFLDHNQGQSEQQQQQKAERKEGEQQHEQPLATPTTRRALSENPSSRPLSPEILRERTRISLLPNEPSIMETGDSDEGIHQISTPPPPQSRPSLAMSYIRSSPPEPQQLQSSDQQQQQQQPSNTSGGFHIQVDDEFYNDPEWENLPVIDNDYEEPVDYEDKTVREKQQRHTRKSGNSSLTNTTIKHLVNKFSHHPNNQVIDTIAQVSEEYFNQISQDLADFAAHAGRKTISLDDTVLLFKRQRKINPKNTSLFDLAHQYLPLELMEEIPLEHKRKKKKKKLDSIQ